MADGVELERCLKRLHATERACRQADVQLSSLREKRAMLEQERQKYAADANALRLRLQHRPYIGLSGFPNDVLLCIFEQLCIINEARWDVEGSNAYDDVRFNGPFHLAAVCTQWRRVAIGFSRLWTYVAFPPPEGYAQAHFSRIRLNLERCKSSAMDVLVQSQWARFDDGPGQRGQWLEHIASFLTAVGSHAHHWGRVEVSTLSRDDLRLFATSTPCLTHLKIDIFDDDPHENPPTHDFLPFAPLLRHLSVDANVLCSDAHPGFPALVSLAVAAEDPSWHQIRQLLTLGGESLETAAITMGSPPTDHVDTPPVSLPRLRSLVLTCGVTWFDPPHERWSWNIITPNLTTLCLDGDLDYDNLVPFLHQLSPTVTSLILCGQYISLDVLDVVLHLRNVSHLAFGTIAGEDTYIVYDEFFVRIADKKPPVWPRLTRVELGPHGDMVSSSGQGLLQLIAARGHFNTELPSGVDIVREVVVQDANTSPGVKAAIARLLSE